MHFFNYSSDCLFSFILHVTIPSINGFTLISWPSRLMLQSTLFAALVYRQAVLTALWFGIFLCYVVRRFRYNYCSLKVNIY